MAALMADKVESMRAERPSPSSHAVLSFGLALGAMLAIVGGYIAFADRENRLDAAEQQSLALVLGGERLVWLEMRNLERALLGIASDAEQMARESPRRANVLLEESMRGVAARQPELESIVVTDARGIALTPGRSDASLPQWADVRRENAMSVGPMQRVGTQWVIPLAVAMRDGRRVLARLRTGELQRLMVSLDTGRMGRVQLLHQVGGAVVADSRGSQLVGRRTGAELPPTSEQRSVVRSHLSGYDNVERVQAVGWVMGYPLLIRVGLARSAIVAPWWRLIAWGTLLYLLYWCGLLHLVRVVRRNSRARAQLMQQLTRSANDLRLAQQLGRMGTWAVEQGDRIVWSEQVSGILGLGERNSATIREFYARIHSDDRRQVADLFAHAWSSHEPFSIDYRLRGADGRVCWVVSRGACVVGADGQPRMTGTIVDITERKEAQLRLADAERHFRYLFDRNPLPFWVFDVATLKFLEVNNAALQQYGYACEEFLGMTILDIHPPEQRDAAMASVRGSARRQLNEATVWLHQRKDGSLIEVCIYAADIEFRGRPARLVLAEDVSQSMAQQRELAYRASHDAVTGLLNARAFAEELDASMPSGCTIAYVQVRGIEAIEDSMGHQAGEDMLRTLAQRLQEVGRAYGAVGHIRPEEFALAVRGEDLWNTALPELRDALSRPLQGHDLLQRLEFWIGVAQYPADGAETMQAIGNAGLAAHIARAERLPLVRFQPEMAQRANARLRLAGRVHEAIDNAAFVLHFQIIRHVDDGRPAALEALIRWPQPQGGFIPPSEFIGICEDSGLIVPLGRWVLREAAITQRRLAEAGFGHLPIAVNVSLMQFLHSDLAADVDGVIGEFALPRGALHVELTESVLMTRPEQALAVLKRLQTRGVCVSLDDFGTGFSSMSYLRYLPLDALKIDRSFVHEVDSEERNASICLALLAMGHKLGLTVIAEGVETEAEFLWLREHSCDQVQGYGLDRPAPVDDVIALLGSLKHNATPLPWPTAAGDR